MVATLQAQSASVLAKVVATANLVLTGLPIIDGYQTVAGDQILLTAQTIASENGLWLLSAGAWARPSDFDTGDTVDGKVVAVTGGTVGRASIWLLVTTSSLTIGTSPQTWSAIVGVVPDGTYADLVNGIVPLDQLPSGLANLDGGTPSDPLVGSIDGGAP